MTGLDDTGSAEVSGGPSGKRIDTEPRCPLDAKMGSHQAEHASQPTQSLPGTATGDRRGAAEAVPPKEPVASPSTSTTSGLEDAEAQSSSQTTGIVPMSFGETQRSPDVLGGSTCSDLVQDSAVGFPAVGQRDSPATIPAQAENWAQQLRLPGLNTSGPRPDPSGMQQDSQPQLRHASLKDAIMRDWSRSPEYSGGNPLNDLQRHLQLYPRPKEKHSQPHTGSDVVLTGSQLSSSGPSTGRSVSHFTAEGVDEAMRPPLGEMQDKVPDAALLPLSAMDSGIINVRERSTEYDGALVHRSSPKRRKLDIGRLEPGAPTPAESSASDHTASRKQRPPKPAAKPRQITSRMELAQLQNAKYNERGEIVEEIVDRPTVTGTDESDAHATENARGKAIAPRSTGTSVKNEAPATVVAESSHWTDGLSRRERALLLNAKYNERGEIITEAAASSVVTLDKKADDPAGRVPPLSEGPAVAGATLEAPASGRTKSKSKAKPKQADARSNTSFATPEPPLMKRGDKKGDKMARIVEDSRSVSQAHCFAESPY